MPRDHDGCKRGFIRFTQAYYAETVRLKDGVTEEITFGLYHPEGGTSGEMAVRWLTVGGQASPRLECFHDAFDALSTFADLLPKLAEFDHDQPRMTPDAFCALLLSAGFEDLTKRAPSAHRRQAILATLTDLETERTALDKRIGDLRNQIGDSAAA